MGGVGAGLGGVLALGTKNPLSKALGTAPEQNDYFQPGMFDEQAPGYTAEGDLQRLQRTAGIGGNYDYQNLSQAYSNGQINEQQLMEQLGKLSTANDPDSLAAARERMYVDPQTGSRLATEQVMNSPIFSQYFGKGGSLQGAMGEEKDLMGRGYQLTPEDREAYGQASGDISRLFGEQENAAAQSLASRGLAAAPSGAAGSMFSGIQGNKMEQLAKAQTNIANQRMTNNLNRLAQTRDYLTKLGSLGNQAVGDQYGRQLAGSNANWGKLTDSFNAAQQKQNSLMQAYEDRMRAFGMNKNLEGQSFESKQANYNPGMFKSIGSGLLSSGNMIGRAPGQFVSSAAGAAGKRAGGANVGEA